jgi:hypothetical protein
MKLRTINATQYLKKKAQPTIVEWKTLKGSRANKFVTVEVGASNKASRSRRKPRQEAQKIENEHAIPHGPPMDIDETLWVEEEMTREKKRVS